MIRFSIVTSVYQDGYLARDFCLRVGEVFSDYLDIEFSELASDIELIFVNDGSPDDSLEKLMDVKNNFPFVRVVDLSRNFGQHEALACGFRLASGSYVIRMNVDMQDPPEELPKLLREIDTGAWDMVVGRYAERNSPWLNRLTAHLYFEAFKFLTGQNVLQRTSPMRVMNRTFLEVYNSLTEKSRFPQGLDGWLGFRQKYVDIEHRPRAVGKSAYTVWSRTRLALTGILYFSDRPLKFMGCVGLILAFMGLFLGAGVVLEKLYGGTTLPGYASLAAIALVGFGTQISFMGVLGLYIGQIFREVQNRPLYIIRKVY
jgi:dolichol-phosphate mannosyltransferase